MGHEDATKAIAEAVARMRDKAGQVCRDYAAECESAEADGLADEHTPAVRRMALTLADIIGKLPLGD